MTDWWAPSWKVRVNGKSQEVLVADFVYRVVMVEPGGNLSQFRYWPWGWPYLLILSWRTLLMLGVCQVVRVMRGVEPPSSRAHPTQLLSMKGRRVMEDLTKQYSYEKLIQEEKEHYSQIEVTDDLTEGGVHANSSWSYYWQRIATVIGQSEYANLPVYLDRAFGSLETPIRILSLGSGYCGNEIGLAKGLASRHIITCTDINEEIFSDARKRVQQENLSIEFRVEDLNFIKIPKGECDLIFAHAALHHIINLEYLLDQIVDGLSDNGVFHLVEVTGMNRKLIWDENERFANALLSLMPDRITRKLRLDVRAEAEGMEGVRQEEILPLLHKRFRPIFEWRHGAFMRFICTHPDLGRYFDPADNEARRYLDFLIDCDESSVRRGVLKPLELWGVYQPLH